MWQYQSPKHCLEKDAYTTINFTFIYRWILSEKKSNKQNSERKKNENLDNAKLQGRKKNLMRADFKRGKIKVNKVLLPPRT